MTASDLSSSQFGGAKRSVRCGGVPREELWLRLERAGVRFNESAERLFADERFVPSSEERLFETFEVSAAELGLPEGATFAAIVRRAAACGLALCPLELGPHLRLELTDQPEGFLGMPQTSHCAPPGSIIVASAPLADDEETPKGFYLRRIEGVLWLRGFRASDDFVYAPHDVFLFCRPGQPSQA